MHETAERVEVGGRSFVAHATGDLLGRHVRRRARVDRRACFARTERVRDAEVAEQRLGHAALGAAIEQDVARLHVAVDDAARVGMRERVEEAHEQAHEGRVIRRQRRVVEGARVGADHDEVGRVREEPPAAGARDLLGDLTVIEHRHDRRMIEARERADLVAQGLSPHRRA
jgi:hypothetical protein